MTLAVMDNEISTRLMLSPVPDTVQSSVTMQSRTLAKITSAAATVAFAAAAVYFCYHESVWHDEAWSMTTAQGSFADAIQRALKAEQQPPLYFVVLDAWLRILRSVGFARVLSTAAIVAAAWVTAHAASTANKGGLPDLIPGTLLLIFGSPFAMYLATEARSYALQTLLGALLVWILANAVLVDRVRHREVVMIGAIGVIAAYTHYMAVLPVVAVTATLVLTRRLALRSALLLAAVEVALGAPLLFYVGGHFIARANVYGPWFEGAGAVFRRLSELVLPAVTRRALWQGLAVAALAVVAAAQVRLRLRRQEHPSRGETVLWLAAAITVVLLLVVGLVGGEAAVEERYMAAALPIFWVAAMLVLRFSLGRLATVALLAILCTLGGSRIFRIHRVDRPGRWRNVAEGIRAGSSGPEAPVFVYPPVEALALRIELKQRERVIGFPHDFDGSAIATPADYFVENMNSFREQIAARVGSSPFWLAYESPVFFVPAGVQPSLDVVTTFVERYAIVRGAWTYPRKGGLLNETTCLRLLELADRR